MRYIFYIIISLLFLQGCGNSGGSDSPSNAVKDFVKALREQNSGRAWNYLSKNSQAMYDDIARSRNQSGKEYFEKSVSDVSTLGMVGMDFDVVDEKKSGDTATVVIMTKEQKTSDLYAVREGGVWKLDYARSIRESMKKLD
jgi:hypothetical protein